MDLHHRPVSLLLLLAACAPATDTDPRDTAPVDSDTVPADILAPRAGPDREVAVGTPITLTGRRNTEGARWDMGDGTQLDGATVTHTYTTPGNYVATYAITTSGGITLTATTRVTAYLPAASTPPVASSALVIDDAEGVVWVAVPEAGHVALFRFDGAVPDPIVVCASPRNLTLAGDFLVVTCEDDDVLTLVSRRRRAVQGRITLPAGTRPFGVVPAEDAGTVWVAGSSAGTWLEVDLATKMVVDTLDRPDPRALVRAPDGTVWGTRFRAVHDDAAVGTGHGELYRGTDTVALAADPGPDSDVAQRGLPNLLHAAAMSPDGGTLYVGGLLSNTLAGTHREGEPFRFDTTVHATLRVIDTATGADQSGLRKQFDNQDMVRAMALSPRGNWLFVAHPGTRTISRLDAYTLRAAGVVPDAGRAIDALGVSSDGSTLYVHAWLERELRAYDVSDPSVASPPLLWTGSTVRTEPLPPDVLAGKRLFHDSADRRIARDGYQHCAVCHPDGRQDGVVWDFTQRGEGLRNTISLEGRAGMGMGPVHWSGNFDEIQDFENDIRYHQGGDGLLSEDDWAEAEDPQGPAKAGRSPDLDHLAAYVSSLASVPTSPWPPSEPGALLFTAAGCDTCHVPPLYTDSAPGVRHDVGTLTAASGQRLGGPLDGLDTPTLLGAFATAPYLHDGSAPTLEAAIAAHTLDGLTLTTVDISRLAAFVRSL